MAYLQLVQTHEQLDGPLTAEHHAHLISLIKKRLPPDSQIRADYFTAKKGRRTGVLENMKSTSGMCVTLGVGHFISSSKIQKLNSKSPTEAKIIAVSDGMNIPLWLADFLAYQ
jgi:O-methyltransferase involved in polyketide biosynthesis